LVQTKFRKAGNVLGKKNPKGTPTPSCPKTMANRKTATSRGVKIYPRSFGVPLKRTCSGWGGRGGLKYKPGANGQNIRKEGRVPEGIRNANRVGEGGLGTTERWLIVFFWVRPPEGEKKEEEAWKGGS